MRWVITVDEPEGVYDTPEEQDRAMQISDDFADALREALVDEFGGDWTVEVNV